MPEARCGSACGLTSKGIVIAGGATDVAYASEVFRFDPVAGTWANLPPLPQAIGYAGGAGVGSAMHVIGGRVGSSAIATHYYYDAASSTGWLQAPSTSFPRYQLGVAAVGTTLFMVGGAAYPNVYAQAEAMDSAPFALNQMQALAPMTESRSGFVLAPDAAGALYAVGGWNNGPLATVEVLVP